MKYFAILFLISLGLNSDNPKLVPVKVTREITVSLPESFQPLSEDEIRRKYNAARRPIVSFASQDQKTDFSVNIFTSTWKQDDIELLQSFYRSSISNLYDSISFIKEEIKEINDRRFIVFEFISLLNPDPDAVRKQPIRSNYTYMQYCLVNEKLLLFNLTTSAAQRPNWDTIAEEIMGTIKIKKTL